METKAYSYIRFSRPEQLKGNSLERQLEASRKYANDHGWILDESMQDLGLSAFHGIHKVKGALGKFLELVKVKKIPQGSYLIVENLDRLSREEVLEALTQFTSIIQANITIVTLQDGMVYSKESITDNWAQLIISITYMARAFDESKRKSQRLLSAWVSKREKAVNGEIKLTKTCPLWLRLSNDKKKFEVIQEAADVINIIFDKKLEGKGTQRIAKELNKSNLWKPEGKRGKPASWGLSYIDRILRNDRRIIGEFQPSVRIEGKRVKHGEPITDYYPIIVPIEKYNRVQSQIQHNREISGYAGGRNDKMYNLFSHIAICSHCGFSMLYRNKGVPPRGGKFYQCDKSFRGLSCDGGKMFYDKFEENILIFCKGLDVSDVIPSNSQTLTELSTLQNHLQSIDGEIIDTDKRLQNVYDSMEIATNVTVRNTLNERATSLIEKKEQLSQDKADTKIKIEKLVSNGKSTEDQLKSIRELIERMKELEGQEKIDLRLNLRNLLRKLIQQIKVDTKNKTAVIFFHSGQRRSINLQTSEIILDSYPKKIFKGKKQ